MKQKGPQKHLSAFVRLGGFRGPITTNPFAQEEQMFIYRFNRDVRNI
jgi:hypothetical protein